MRLRFKISSVINNLKRLENQEKTKQSVLASLKEITEKEKGQTTSSDPFFPLMNSLSPLSFDLFDNIAVDSKDSIDFERLDK